MSEPHHLIPSAVKSHAKVAKRFPYAFGPRFFLLLLIGLVWIGPAWNDRRYLYAMFLSDAAVVVAWIWDLRRLPRQARRARPGQLRAQLVRPRRSHQPVRIIKGSEQFTAYRV